VSGQRKALIIANDEYEQEALQNLLAPAADAEALGRVLGDPQIGDFAVQVVHNEPAHVIQAQIEEVFSESRPDDVLLLHFSGHGLKSESGELFFAASNTRPNRLGSTAVSADFVQRCMRNSRSRSVVLLLDCCYGGAFAQGARVRAAGDVNVLDSFPQERSGGRGRAVITASSAMEYAFEGNQLGDDQQRQPSVFTSALVEGLATGEADQDEDGWVSLDELYEYVFDKVREQNPHQTPSRQVELEGELYLARSRRRRIRPEPIPSDLQAALVDPNMYMRLGAVTELRSRLVSENLLVAAGAYQALAELVRTGIRYVAEPAAEALSQAAVRPDQTELHFGRVEQDSAPPHRTVQLLGPPIARACMPRPSHDWIRVDQMGERLDISIDTARTGTLQGSLDLKGPTGVAVIAIDIDLVSTPPQRPTYKRAPRTPKRETVTAREEVQDKARRQADLRAAIWLKPKHHRPAPMMRSAEPINEHPRHPNATRGRRLRW
jgi:Caspase domain